MPQDQALHFILTGGTIDSAYYPPKETSVPGVESVIPSYINDVIRPHMKVSFETICMLDSDEITDEIRGDILQAVQNAPSNHIIICHGTNTMIKTAEFLKAHISAEKTVVLTGSMIPLKDIAQSDGGFNLGFAAAQVQYLPSGVYVAMHGQVFTPENVRKNFDIARFEDA